MADEKDVFFNFVQAGLGVGVGVRVGVGVLVGVLVGYWPYTVVVLDAENNLNKTTAKIKNLKKNNILLICIIRLTDLNLAVNHIYMTLLLVIFVSLLIAEGLGFDRNLFLYFYLCLPAVISLIILLKKKSLFLPKKTSLIFLIYLVIAFLSFIYSVDKQNAFEWFLFYASSFLVYIFAYNFKNEGKKLITFAIIFGSLVFLLYFLAGFFFPSLKTLQTTGYQLVRSVFGLHNHLGDFLGLTIVYFIFLKNYIFLALFAPFFLLSYSRSSYLALVSTLLVYWRGKSVNYSKKIIVIVVGLVLLFGASSLFFKTIPGLENTLKFFHQTENTNTKDLFSGRNNYLEQIKSAFLERPILGFGMGNFGYVSSKFRQIPGQWTETAHNVFLETLVETGALGFLALLFFIFLILKSAKKDSVFFSLALYLLINFQTDYTYKIFSLFILFMLLLGVVNEEKERINDKISKGVFLAISLFLLIVVQQILYGRVLLSLGKTRPSLLAYPFNKELLKATDLDQYLKAYPYDTRAIKKSARLNEKAGNYEKAASLFEKSYYLNRFENFDLIKDVYRLRKKLNGIENARIFAGEELKRYKKLPEWVLSEKQKEQIRNFCIEVDVSLCHKIGFSRFKYFWQPKADSLEHPNPQLTFSKVKNRLNADGLNDRFNYSVKKPKDTFRIMVLGGSEAYGQYVDTKDNWTELLEDDLNKNLSCAPYKKVEVINLGMYGYDIAYSVERFFLKGKKYHPDMIIFLTPSLYILNEEIQPRMDSTSDWQKAFDKTIADIGEEKIFSRQKELLKKLRSYSYEIIYITDKSFNVKEISVIREINNQNNIFEENLENKKEFYFPDGYSLNTEGHKITAERTSNLIGYNKLCSKP